MKAHAKATFRACDFRSSDPDFKSRPANTNRRDSPSTAVIVGDDESRTEAVDRERTNGSPYCRMLDNSGAMRPSSNGRDAGGDDFARSSVLRREINLLQVEHPDESEARKRQKPILDYILLGLSRRELIVETRADFLSAPFGTNFYATCH